MMPGLTLVTRNGMLIQTDMVAAETTGDIPEEQKIRIVFQMDGVLP
jgi:hypothetical protein